VSDVHDSGELEFGAKELLDGDLPGAFAHASETNDYREAGD